MLITRRGFIQRSTTGLLLIGGGIVNPLSIDIINSGKNTKRYQILSEMTNKIVEFRTKILTDSLNKESVVKQFVENSTQMMEKYFSFILNEFDPSVENKKESSKQLNKIIDESSFLDRTKICDSEYIMNYKKESENLYDSCFVLLNFRSVVKSPSLNDSGIFSPSNWENFGNLYKDYI